ncbi:transposase [uncultured Nostoc sp.]|uniref:transposase n=1 Tax=uncultured Nostoc sp. TaxID=340711 RepID=UPI0035CB51B6
MRTVFIWGVCCHLVVVNEFGQLLNVTLTPSNIDDPKLIPDFLHELFGKIFDVSEAEGIAAMFLKNLFFIFWKSSESNFSLNPVAI